MSSAPILADITVNGRAIKAVAVPSKQAFLYVFDRVTGQPVWPIEERPVPQTDVPGEKTTPDAAVPDQAAGVRAQCADAARRSDRLHAGSCARRRSKQIERYKVAPWMFNPPMLGNVNGTARRHQHGQRGRRHQLAGRALRSGNAHHLRAGEQRRHHVDVARRRRRRVSRTSATCRASQGGRSEKCSGPGDCCAADSPRAVRRRQRAERAAARDPARRRRPQPRRRLAAGGLTVEGLPILKPPYGTISAVNLDRGEIVWQVPHGDTPDNVRNHPALQGPDHPEDRPGQARRRRSDGHQDAGRDGRSAGDDDAGASARRDAARVRQDDRARKSARC